MIETVDDCRRFLSESDGDWIVHAVPVEEGIHPADNTPSILFIRVISTGKTYWFALNHPDSKPIINLSHFLSDTKNLKWALDRKAFCQLIPLPNVYDANLCGFLKTAESFESYEFDTPAHGLVRRNSNGMGGINRIIPLMKHLESFDDLCDTIKKMIGKMDKSILLVNDITLETLGRLESTGIFVDAGKFKKYFSVKPNSKGLVFSQYNIYTSTGRPSNRFGGINYAALNAKDGSRTSFVSRYGENGRIVVVDYTAFHPRIICMLTGYQMPVDTNVYSYLANLIFKSGQ